jgi:MSHA biogenesis protein MshP
MTRPAHAPPRHAAARRAPPRPRVGGFALVPALFLLVVLGALGLVAIRVGTGQQQAVTMGLMQARALAAANAGIEWAAYLATTSTPANPTCPASSTTLSLTEGALNGFSVVVTCSVTTFTNSGGSAAANGGTAGSFVIQATATYGTYGQPGYVKRVVTGTFTTST